jgi:hypothetical protein
MTGRKMLVLAICCLGLLITGMSGRGAPGLCEVRLTRRWSALASCQSRNRRQQVIPDPNPAPGAPEGGSVGDQPGDRQVGFGAGSRRPV